MASEAGAAAAAARPLVSIITVTKNCADTLEATLDSVTAVKGPEVEYVVVDGASTDGTLRLLDEYQDIIDRLISEADGGIYEAMNKGAGLASGRYLVFLNGDDRLLADGFRSALDELRGSAPQVLCCHCEVRWPGDACGSKLAPRPWLLPFFNTIPHLGAFIAADLLRTFPYRQDLRIAADYDLFLRLLLTGKRFQVSDAISGLHFRGGLSANIALSAAEVEQVKQANLGVAYHLIRAIEGAYRFGRRALSSRRECKD